MSPFHVGKLLFTQGPSAAPGPGRLGRPLRVQAGVSVLVAGKAVDYVIA
jgi:hypothetical protein